MCYCQPSVCCTCVNALLKRVHIALSLQDGITRFRDPVGVAVDQKGKRGIADLYAWEDWEWSICGGINGTICIGGGTSNKGRLG